MVPTEIKFQLLLINYLKRNIKLKENNILDKTTCLFF